LATPWAWSSRGNVVSNGFGEGINLGKNTTDVTCEDNVVVKLATTSTSMATASCAPSFGATSPTAPAIRRTCGRTTKAPAGFAVKDETTRQPFSADIVFEHNIAVNCGIPIEVNPRGRRRRDGCAFQYIRVGAADAARPWLSGGMTNESKWLTAISGIVAAVFALLVVYGIITAEQGELWSALVLAVVGGIVAYCGSR
jgi:hypothetical protein